LSGGRQPKRRIPATGARGSRRCGHGRTPPRGDADRQARPATEAFGTASVGATRWGGGTLRLRVPAGWRTEPDAVPVTFTAAGEERFFDFNVFAPADLAEGRVTL